MTQPTSPDGDHLLDGRPYEAARGLPGVAKQFDLPYLELVGRAGTGSGRTLETNTPPTFTGQSSDLDGAPQSSSVNRGGIAHLLRQRFSQFTANGLV